MKNLFSSLCICLFLFIAQTSFAMSQTVIMKDNYFSPKTITISAGQTVNWVNQGMKEHNVSSSMFNSGKIPPGAGFRYTFTTPGTYTYKCKMHTFFGFGMTGKVIVQ